MSNAMIVRAWKDKTFRAELGADAVPAHPAGTGEATLGLIDLGDFITGPICSDTRCSDRPSCN